MDHDVILRPDLQDLLNKYREMRDKFSALCAFSEQQQRSLEFEREQTERVKNKLKSMLCWFMKREDRYKADLDNLERRNKELNYNLTIAQYERDDAALLNNAKVSELQDEIDRLQAEIVQLRNDHKQQLMLQEKSYEDEISKYKHLIENMTKSFLEQNVIERDKSKNVKEHPALINEENKKRKGKHDKLPDLKIEKIVPPRKRRKLFQDDKEMIDII